MPAVGSGFRGRAGRWIALPVMCVAAAGLAATAATAYSTTTALPSATTGSTAPFATALFDPLFIQSQKATAFAMTSQAGAKYVRLDIGWRGIAPANLPATGFNPTDPTSRYYTWAGVDAIVQGAEAAGLTPIIDITNPPSWAWEVQPTSTTGGAPKIGALGDFATALARHFNAHPHIYDVWNEPNFTKNFSPADPPAYYRAMANAIADAVHGVNPANLAAAGELAPFKHLLPSTVDPSSVLAPLTFMQQMLCVSADATPVRTCNATVHIDVWTHHPYSDNPFAQATAPGGVELGDLPAMYSLLQQARSLGAIVSAKPVQLWVTEAGWASNAPNTKGVPMKLESRWVAESLYQMWKSGVTVGGWFLLQDMPSTTAFQSGLYFNSTSLTTAVAKPLLTPFRFPFVAYLGSNGNVAIWGRDATSDTQTVTIQHLVGGLWTDVGTIKSNGHGIFQATLPLGATSTWTLRAVAPGSGESLAFALKVPLNENMRATPFPTGG